MKKLIGIIFIISLVIGCSKNIRVKLITDDPRYFTCIHEYMIEAERKGQDTTSRIVQQEAHEECLDYVQKINGVYK